MTLTIGFFRSAFSRAKTLLLAAAFVVDMPVIIYLAGLFRSHSFQAFGAEAFALFGFVVFVALAFLLTLIGADATARTYADKVTRKEAGKNVSLVPERIYLMPFVLGVTIPYFLLGSVLYLTHS